jgi:hypothetical protein
MKLLVEITRITKDARTIEDISIRVIRNSVYRVLIHCTESVREAERRD